MYGVDGDCVCIYLIFQYYILPHVIYVKRSDEARALIVVEDN